MEKEHLIKFLGKRVKLVKSNGFLLNGTIDAVYNDAIEFTTEQATSLISLDIIKEIVLLNRWRY